MSTKKKILIILLIGLAIRSGLLIRHHHTYYLSGLTQGLLARNIVQDRGLVVGEKERKLLVELQGERRKLVDISEIPVFENDNYFSYIDDMPGHGILLAGIWKITQHYRYIYIQIFQIIIDSLMILLIFLICRSLFSEKIATLASFLYTIYLPQAFLSVHPLRDCWVMFVAIAIVYLIICYYKKPNIVNALSVGILTGLGTYMRPNLILIALVCSIFALFYLGKRNCLKLILLGSLVIAAIMSPWWIRNWKIYHRFVPLSANFGHVMWVGLGVIPNEYGFVHSDEAAADYVTSAGYDSRYITPKYGRVLLKRALQVIKKDPIFYIRVLIHCIPVAIFPAPEWGIEPKDFAFIPKWNFALWRKITGRGPIAYTRAHPFISSYKLMRRMLAAVLFFLALGGMWLERKDYDRLLLLVSVPFYFVFVHFFMDVDPRYVFPGTWVYLVFSAIFVENLLERRKSSREAGFEIAQKE